MEYSRLLGDVAARKHSIPRRPKLHDAILLCLAPEGSIEIRFSRSLEIADGAKIADKGLKLVGERTIFSKSGCKAIGAFMAM